MTAVRTVSVYLKAQVADYTAKMGQARKYTTDLGAETAKLGKTNTAAMRDIERGAGVAGIALAGLAGWAVKAGLAFDKQMSEVSAVTNASAEDLESLRQAALDAGKATVFSATESAQAEAALGKAGLKTSEILGGALSGALDLASAGSLDLAEAADISAKSMRVFGLQGKDVSHIADVLASGANKSATDVHELGEALRMGGLAAATAGLTLDQTVGTLAAFADRALVGSDAGTSLKTMLQFLANPTEKAAGLMEELGIKVYDAGGKFVGVEKLAGILQQRLSGLTQQQRQSALATIFGSDATRAATVLYELGEDGVRQYIKAVDDSGAAARTAGEKTNNLAGDIERLKGSLETLAIDAQSGANGGLRYLVQTVDNLVGRISDLPRPVQSAITLIAGLSGAVLLGVIAWLKLRTTMREAIEALKQAGPASQAAAKGLEVTSKWAGRAAIAFTALTVASAVIDSLDGDAVKVDELNGSLMDLVKTGKATGEVAREFGGDLEYMTNTLALSGDGMSSFSRQMEGLIPGLKQLDSALLGVSFIDAEQRVTQLDAALAKMIADGHVNEAMEIYSQVLRQWGGSFEELQAKFPGYFAALHQAKEGTDLQAQAAANAVAQNAVMASGFEEAARSADGLTGAFKTLHGAQQDWAGAEINVEAGLDRLQAALEASNGSFSVHTEKGRAAKSALMEYAQETAKAAQAKLDESKSVEEANATYQHYRDQLVETLIGAGKTRREAEKLADAWLSMPKYISTTVEIDVKTKYSGAPGDPLGYAGYYAHRWGGIDYAMSGGGTLGAHVARSPTVLYGERETGGEAFVPKNGDYDRSMRILQEAAGWYGATVNPYGQRSTSWSGGGGGGGGAGGVVMLAPINLPSGDLDSAVFASLQRKIWNQYGGNVVVAFQRKR